MTVRPAAPGDEHRLAELAAGVQELHRAGAPDWFKPVDHDEVSAYFGQLLSAANAYVFVAEQACQLNGYVLARVYQFPDTALTYAGTVVELDQIAVDVSRRRQGIGTSLVERVNQLASELRAHRVQLTVWEFNQVAQSMFEQAGFSTAMRRMIKTG
jgi:ribosomal protein S18 acetylase RimI-like enzyme